MDASASKLQAILQSPNRYIVPVFQRYYSWGLEDWEKLWDDIESLMTTSKEKTNPTHFMGSLVFIPERLLPNAMPTFQIIDGQQRMMTIIILLCAVRDIANSYNFSELADEIDNTYIFHQYKKGLERYKVFPRHQDKEDFMKAVNGDDEPENSVGEALDFFRKKILKNPYLSSEEELRDFLNLLASGLEFVHITLDKENPYQIFKSLNSTGVDLDEGDLIRNFVFMHLPTERQSAFDENHWKPLELKFTDEEGNLDGKLISNFFRDFLMHNGSYVGLSETYQSFEAKYATKGFDPNDIVDQLHEAADIYNTIRGETAHKNKNVEAALQKLRELSSSTAYPLVLKLMLMDLTPEDLQQALNWISSFILRRYICQDSSRAYGRWFVDACSALEDQPLENLRMFLISKGFPSDTRFQEQFLHFNLYGSRYAKSILAQIEQSYGHKEPADLADTQVEHIMPQKLNPIWEEELGPNFQDIQETMLHTIGNLTLTGYNPELSNHAFSTKMVEYENSHITITKIVADYQRWNKESIMNRAKELFSKAKEIWKAPDTLTPENQNEISDGQNDDKIALYQKMINRRNIADGQIELYSQLYQADDEGISLSNLAEKMGRTNQQLAGVLGALGRRINGTEGLDDGQGISHIFDIWEIKGEIFYRLKPEFRAALENEKIVQQLV